MRQFSSNIRRIDTSASIGMAETVKKLKSKGVDIIDLSWGEPDFPAPRHVIEAATTAMEKGETKYTSSLGILDLRTAIAEKLEKDNGLFYSPQNEILISPGCKQAILYAFLIFLDEGDEVLIPEPCWLSYADQIAMTGGIFIPIASTVEKGFRVSKRDIMDKVTDRTKMILINNPTNPTGVFWAREDLADIAAVAREKDLIVISDEIYEKILFDEKKSVSIASLPDMKERTIVVNGFSKSYSMTGFRIGYVASSAPIINEMLKVHQHSATCASSISQASALAALTGDQSSVTEMVNEYAERRDLFVDEINTIAGFSCLKPTGTFYAFVGIKGMNMSSLDALKYLLENHGIAAVPGSAYGKSGEGYLRFSLTQNKNKIITAINRIKKG